MEQFVPNYRQHIYEDKSYQEKGEHYKAAAGILPICEITGRLLLFMRVYKEGDDESGKWDVAGGSMNDNELKVNVKVGSREAALREFKEETGQSDPFSRLIESYVYTSPDGGFNYYNYIGIVPEEFEPKLNEEHNDAKWFSLEDLKLIPRNQFHFGVKLLFANDQDTIMKYAK